MGLELPVTPLSAQTLYAERLPGFTERVIDVGETGIHCLDAGAGKPVLLLHGHPQNLLTWWRIAPRLVEAGYHVVLADLRGYGDSGRPPGGEGHIGYSKRAMAADQLKLMRALGADRFTVIGHDRGARVAHRMALDFPEAVERLALFDIAPTATMYARADKAFATRYFWWFFLIQPFDMPERMIGADPAYFLKKHIDGQVKTPGAVDPAIFADYLRCYSRPETIHAICEDYRAAATIDLAHDAADAEKRVTAPVLALWGAKGVVGQTYDVLATWREKAIDVSGKALDCGHTLQEEAPEAVLAEILPFLAEGTRGPRMASAVERAQAKGIIFRPHRVGDIGMIVSRQAALYAEEHGWDIRFEGLIARIGADFIDNFDSAKEACWIAEYRDRMVGAVFCVKAGDELAKLRMLHVEPDMRGWGIGAALVDLCMAFARERGYRRMTLWTNDILHAARRLYEARGFRLLAEEKHHSFGHDLVGQNWECEL
jgi:haloacetate dehalogenase